MPKQPKPLGNHYDSGWFRVFPGSIGFHAGLLSCNRRGGTGLPVSLCVQHVSAV